MVSRMNQNIAPVKDDSKSRTAYSYIRFSRAEQIKGDSQRRQYETTLAYCARNNLVLDETLSLQDLGISAYRSKNATHGALSAFIRAVESGKIPHGSTLIVESLDRLSRDQLGRAQSLVLGILEQGITIVTLSPEREYTPDSANNLGAAIEIIVTLYRAHEESAMKSRRIGAAWATKRKNVGQRKLTARCPAWLSLSEDRTEFHVLSEPARTVRRIFQMVVDGFGVDSIARTFNRDGVPPIARVQTWHRSYILKILGNRSVLGEFQPHKLISGKRQPTGEPIIDYFPVIIDEQLFYQAQQAKASRRGKQGRRGAGVSNLFTGLLRNTIDGSSMVMVSKGKDGSRGGKRLTSSAAIRGENEACRCTIRYESFEQQMLTWLGGLDGAMLAPDSDSISGEKELEAVDGMLVDVNDRIAKIEARMVDGPPDKFDSLLSVLGKLQEKVGELKAQREELRGKVQSGRINTLQTYRTAWQRLGEVPDDQKEYARSRLRTAIAAMVDRIDITPERDGILCHVLVKIYLKGASDPWYIYFVARGLKSAWISIGGWADVDLQSLKEARYVPFSWKNIPKACEADMAVGAPIVNGVPSEINDILDHVTNSPTGDQKE
jgi:DNA invertase Pin-like site-specific DNA recombinase